MFPSTLSIFPRPTPSNRLDNPSHSSLHNQVSSAIGQLEAVIGVEGANSVVGTLMYQVQSPDSNGGGHVQTANKGGTGQTTYTKGDLLVAQSQSVLTKLAVGVDGQALIANSSVAGGVNWGTPTTTKIGNSGSLITLTISSNIGLGPQSLMSASVIGGTLGTSGAIRTRIFVNNISASGNTPSVLVNANYGASTVASTLLRLGNANPSLVGVIEYDLISTGVNSQRGNLVVNLGQPISSMNGIFPALNIMSTGVSSINSATNQVVGFTITAGNGAFSDAFIQTIGYTSEKIV